MKRQLICLVLAVAAAALSGCYYDPGYSHVRGSVYGGDAYYGRGSTYYAAPGYYDHYYPAYYGGYYPRYYGGYYGCCYAPGVSIGVSGYWHGSSRYRSHPRYRQSYGHGYRGRSHYRGGRGVWSGHRGSVRGGNLPSGHRGPRP